MDSKLILPGTSSAEIVVVAVSEAKHEIGKVNPRNGNANWGLRISLWELRKERFWDKLWGEIVVVEVLIDW